MFLTLCLERCVVRREMERIRMKDLPRRDRPYEKCLSLGAERLTDTELLAVILRTGSRDENSLALAGRLLNLDASGDGLLGLLHHSLDEFMKIKGVGKVKGVQLLCIGELSKRIWKRKASEHPITFGHPQEISDYYMEDMRHLEQEEIRVMYLNTKQALIRDQILSRGTVNASVMTPREVLIEALRCRAVSMVMVHNHPSGDPSPSRADILLTRRVREAGDLVGIGLIDHIIIGDRRYLSFREQNLM